ncbi:hypothetical protein GCM10010841_31820 [Deinococcus aerophilus]|uniref:Short-chain dehydrogenase n=1 Tax=Deinococcus aerophilus TaxID=522488 RepID=A0ABQ2H102_9DEIO|nr:hypothetical protein GCM10010841_31820 [Deinococcus aerophilus]
MGRSVIKKRHNQDARAGAAPYSSTKHALNNLSLVARAEFAPLGIVINLGHSGMTATNFGYNSMHG